MRYRLVDDDSGHHYFIPANREEEWDTWVHSDEWENGEVPKWAIECNGSPQTWTFTDPQRDFN